MTGGPGLSGSGRERAACWAVLAGTGPLRLAGRGVAVGRAGVRERGGESWAGGGLGRKRGREGKEEKGNFPRLFGI